MTDNALNQIKIFVIEELKKSYSQATVNLWFEPLKVVSLEGNALTVSITQVKKAFVESQYYEVLKEKFSQVIGIDIKLSLISDEEEAEMMPEFEEKVESAYKIRFNPITPLKTSLSVNQTSLHSRRQTPLQRILH